MQCFAFIEERRTDTGTLLCHARLGRCMRICVSMCVSDLKLQFHGGDGVSGRHLSEFLDVCVQAPRRDLRVPAGSGLQQGLVDEDILIFRLHHVVPLSTHAGHVTVDIHRLLVLHPLKHGLYYDKTACPTHTSASMEKQGNIIFRLN